MLFSVPQYIDIEDKIAGPLTAKQLLWMAGMAATGFLLYVMLPKIFFYALLVPVVLIFLALAFYRPQGQAFYVFVFNLVNFMFHSKVYVWRRSSTLKQIIQEKQAAQKENQKKKQMLTSEELADLARMLDSAGMERNKQIMELVKKRQQNIRHEEKKPAPKKDKTILTVFRKKIEEPKKQEDVHLSQTKEDQQEIKKKVVQLKPEDPKGRIIYIK